MRSVILIFLSISALTAAAFGACVALHYPPHAREWILAGVVCLIASVTACVPLWLTRGGTQATVVQASLIGLVAHMIAVLILAAGILVLGLVAGRPFLFCLIAQYWASLIVVSIIFVKTLREAPIGKAGPLDAGASAGASPSRPAH